MSSCELVEVISGLISRLNKSVNCRISDEWKIMRFNWNSKLHNLLEILLMSSE